MELTLLVLIEFGFIFAGMLPAVFFQSGAKKNLSWFVSCVPFFILPFLILFHYFDATIDSVVLSSSVDAALSGLAVFCCMASMLLINWSVLSHSKSIPLWHQEQHQMPDSLVTHGAYKYIRHPFYTAYLLLFLACFFAWPHIITLFFFLWGVVANAYTANKEERFLSESKFSDAYKQYQASTGFFIPKLFNHQ